MKKSLVTNVIVAQLQNYQGCKIVAKIVRDSWK